MTQPGLVSDSSPLIFPGAVSDLHLLRSVFRNVAIPRAVWREVVIDGRGLPGSAEIERAAGDWLAVADVASRSPVDEIMRQQNLQIGESEAIVLAGECSAPVLLDEQRAVSYARSQGARVVRTPIVYATAKSLGLISSDKLDRLRGKRFFLKDSDYEAILKMVGEL